MIHVTLIFISFYAVPSPTITITSDPIGIISVGGAVTLTCTVELSPSVDIPVKVLTVFTGPTRFLTTPVAQPNTGSNTTYTSTTRVSSFGRDTSGEYACIAYARSLTTSSFITSSNASTSTTRVTVGKNNHHIILQA